MAGGTLTDAGESPLAREFDHCIKCGLCQAVCPVQKALQVELYAPRGKVQLGRHMLAGDLSPSAYAREIFARCLLCGACTLACPSGVDPALVTEALRAKIAASLGTHPRLEAPLRALGERHNISGDENSERAEWWALPDGPKGKGPQAPGGWVYFVGCVASFFPMAQGIPRAVVKILEEAGETVQVLGGEEWCCGFPCIGAGVPGDLETFKAHNLERVKALGAKGVLFSCPSCYRVWKEKYRPEIPLRHMTERLWEIVRSGRLILGEVPLTVTYHDPCDLARHGGVTEAPRALLEAIPGLNLVELGANGRKAVCCGGGGNVEMTDPDLSRRVALQKLAEIRDSGAGTVVTSCQQCLRTIKGAARREKLPLEVLDLTEILERSLRAARKR